MAVDIHSKIQKTKKTILSVGSFKPDIAIIAGSGLNGLKKHFKILQTIQYSKIPYFAATTVKGHSGELHLCRSKNRDMLIFSGRFHFYEGHSAQDIVYPVRVMKSLGIKTLVLTAAAGAVNRNYALGDIVLIKDHINFTGNNPLIGKHCGEFGERFPDMCGIYDGALKRKALAVAKKLKIKLREGVYFGVTGPSYETPAEINAFRILGADIVGMSVVYEALAAAQMDMKVLGLAYVSNMAAGAAKRPLSHKEVLEAGIEAGEKISKILESLIKDI